MPGLFDLIQGAMGRPDPSMQLRAAINPLAGVPASGAPTGPAGPPGASGGPAAPTGSTPGIRVVTPPDGPPGGPPGGQQPQQPPQPMATQTPPDLGSMFVQLMQRQQANEGFNRGLGMLAAGFAQPRDRAMMIDAMSGQSGDPASLMGNVMKLTQYNQQQQRLADMQKNLPALAQSMNIPLEALTTMFNSNPEGFGAEVAKIQEGQLGIGGSPAWAAQLRAEKALTAAGKPIPWTPGDPTSYNAYATADIAEKKQAATDVGDAKDSFSTMNANYTNLRDNMAWIKAHPDAVVEALTTLSPTGGVLGKAAGATGAVSQDALTASQKLALLNTQLYASNFRGTKQRLSQAEAQRLGDQFTTLNKGALNMAPADIKTEINRLSDQIDKGHANIFTSAGQEVPADLDGKADKIYTDPTSSLYAYGNKPVQVAKPPDKPAASSSSSSTSSSTTSSGGSKLTDDQATRIRSAITANPHDRDKILATAKANGFDVSGF